MRIERGSTRVVLVTRRWVVKMPRLFGLASGWRGMAAALAHGWLANLSELDWTRQGAAGIVPVRLSLAGLVQLYPYAMPFRGSPETRVVNGLGFPGPVDNRRANLGWWNGEQAWLDYDTHLSDCVPCKRFGFEQHARHGRAHG